VAVVRASIYSREHRRLAALLREVREERGIRQVHLAKALEPPQSFVSKIEAGQRRLDLVELAELCEAMGIRLSTFVRRFEQGR